jgi:hypothetical protein
LQLYSKARDGVSHEKLSTGVIHMLMKPVGIAQDYAPCLTWLLPSRLVSGKRIIARDQGICAYCGAENSTTVDHVLPVARGGDDSEANLVCACVKCNTSKGKKMPFDFFEPVFNGCQKSTGQLLFHGR